MTNGPHKAYGKTVFVREYLRLRNGRWETVKSHFRRPRRRQRHDLLKLVA